MSKRLKNGIVVEDSTEVILRIVTSQPVTDEELIYTTVLPRAFIPALARGEEICKKTLLYDICDNVHASCTTECPVYDLQTKIERESNECRYHKNGREMLAFIVRRGGN